MITVIDSSGYGVTLDNAILYTVFIIAGVVAIGFYLLRSIGVYTLAKNQQLKRPWLAFIPVVYIYLLCKLLKNARFFFDTFAKLALIITLVFALGEIISFAVTFINYFGLVGYYLQGGEIFLQETAEGLVYNAPYLNDPFNVDWMIKITNVLTIIADVLSLVNTVIIVFITFDLFKMYLPDSYVFISLLSILGLFPILVFIIRKKPAINYAEYVRKKFYRQANRYGYTGDNRYGNNQSNQDYDRKIFDQSSRGEPFSEFDEKDSKKDQPFSEFDEEDK